MIKKTTTTKKCFIIGIKIKKFIFWKILFLAVSQKRYKTEETGIFRQNQFEENTHIRLDEIFFLNLYAFQICQMS